MSVNCFSHCHRCSLCAMNKLSLNYSSFAEGTELCTDKNTKRFFSSWPRAFLSSLFPRCWKVEWTSDDSSIIVTPPSSEHPFMSTIPFLASSHAFFVNENENCAYAVLCSQCFSRFVWLLSVFFFTLTTLSLPLPLPRFRYRYRYRYTATDTKIQLVEYCVFKMTQFDASTVLPCCFLLVQLVALLCMRHPFCRWAWPQYLSDTLPIWQLQSNLAHNQSELGEIVISEDFVMWIYRFQIMFFVPLKFKFISWSARTSPQSSTVCTGYTEASSAPS